MVSALLVVVEFFMSYSPVLYFKEKAGTCSDDDSYSSDYLVIVRVGRAETSFRKGTSGLA